MPGSQIGSVVIDARGEWYIRVDDPQRPWRFLNSLVDGAGVAEPRDESFPHRPLQFVGQVIKP